MTELNISDGLNGFYKGLRPSENLNTIPEPPFVIAGLDPAIQRRMFLKISTFRLNGKCRIIGSSPIMTELNISDGLRFLQNCFDAL